MANNSQDFNGSEQVQLQDIETDDMQNWPDLEMVLSKL